MDLSPEWIATIGFLLIGFSVEAFVAWRRIGDRPLIFANLGPLGSLLELGSMLVVVVGGLSLIVWSFMKLPWYLPFALYIGQQVVVAVVSAPLIVRAVVTSALTPLLGAVGLVALHWLTWFA